MKVLVYKFKKLMGRTDFSDHYRKIIIRHKRIGYDLNVMRQSGCLVINPITVDNFAALFNYTQVGGSSVRLYDGRDLKLLILVGWDRSSLGCCLVHRGSTDYLLLLVMFGRPVISICYATRCIC